ncbi:MAG: prolyl oligopeptidase family serine peptidase [Myxococcota bacterium]
MKYGWLGAAAGLALALGGCGDDAPAMAEGSASSSGGAVGTSTSGAADSTGTDDGPADSSSGEEPEPVPEPPPVAPFFEPEIVEVPVWITAPVDDNPDLVREAIDTGVFTLPEVGEAYGSTWSEHVPGENGELIAASADSLYAAAEIEVPDDRFVFVRDDTVRTMFTNNTNPQPGDVYASGRTRVPLAVQGDPATDLVIVQAYGRRGTPEVQLWSTPDELSFNFADMTLPQYPVGDGSEQYVGVPILNNTSSDTRHLRAHVIENEYFEETIIEYPGLPAISASQIAFRLQPKAPFDTEGMEVPAILRIEPLWFEHSYEREVMVQTVSDDAVYRRTRRSEVDGSVQFYGVRPPVEVEPEHNYGLILTLHGAGVGGAGQAAAYSSKQWAYIIAPTNRRPFGFDWEEWGRLDALEALEHAESFFSIDPQRIHLTGHSMGGHGTWQLGVHYPTRFRVIAPSAGWISFDTYGSLGIPDGVPGAARAASKTIEYITNFEKSPVYIIHGTADDNVPSFQAQTMFDALQGIAPELWYHAQPGAGHWWDADPTEPGADCVDWEPMIDVMRDRAVDPDPLDFRFISAGAWVNPEHSYARILSEDSPLAHPELLSTLDGDAVTLETTNVRSLEIDVAQLLGQGITSLTVDGDDVPLDGNVVTLGPTTGKTPEVHGPLNQVFHEPVCFVYAEDGAPQYREYAAFLTSWWSVIGNGQAITVEVGDLTSEIEENYNIIHLGIPRDEILDLPDAMDFELVDGGLVFGGQEFTQAALAFVYPAATGRLSAVWTTAPGFEYLLFRYMPFSSRNGQPDYYIWRANNFTRVGGFFDADWEFDPSLAEVY